MQGLKSGRTSLGVIAALATGMLSAGCQNTGGSTTANSSPVEAAKHTQTAGATSAASNDDTIKDVQKKIAADKSLNGSKISASVMAGSVQLDGSVKTSDQKDRAESIVRAVQSSRHQQPGVLDNLTVGE